MLRQPAQLLIVTGTASDDKDFDNDMKHISPLPWFVQYVICRGIQYEKLAKFARLVTPESEVITLLNPGAIAALVLAQCTPLRPFSHPLSNLVNPHLVYPIKKRTQFCAADSHFMVEF